MRATACSRSRFSATAAPARINVEPLFDPTGEKMRG